MELASRLSYFLWADMPDDELFRLADAGRLGRPEVLEAQVRRMLADRKSAALVDSFAAQWLQLRTLERVKPDPARFPTVDDELRDAMRRETELFVEAIIREDRSVLDLIDGPFTYLNGPLAHHYGITGIAAKSFVGCVGRDAAGRAAHSGQHADGVVLSTRTRRCCAASGCSTTCWARRRPTRRKVFRRSTRRPSAPAGRCARNSSGIAPTRPALSATIRSTRSGSGSNATTPPAPGAPMTASSR